MVYKNWLKHKGANCVPLYLCSWWKILSSKAFVCTGKFHVFQALQSKSHSPREVAKKKKPKPKPILSKEIRITPGYFVNHLCLQTLIQQCAIKRVAEINEHHNTVCTEQRKKDFQLKHSQLWACLECYNLGNIIWSDLLLASISVIIRLPSI